MFFCKYLIDKSGEFFCDKLKELKNIWNKEKSKAKFSSFLWRNEGRCPFPSNFDNYYCYAFIWTAISCIKKKRSNSYSFYLKENPEDWKASGYPLTCIINMEKREGQMKPVIWKALVELVGKPFKYLEAHRDEYAIGGDNNYTFPGSIQYYGDNNVFETTT